jgi:hypothetical protein
VQEDFGAALTRNLMPRKNARISRRDAPALVGKAGALGASSGGLARLTGYLSDSQPSFAFDSALLDRLQRASFRFFWEQASPVTGLVKDRAAAKGTDRRTLSSIAATGFGLTDLCIAHSRAYQPATQIRQRVIATLDFLLTRAPSVNGFFYHFMDMNTGGRAVKSELSSIDTAILLCGCLTCREYFQDAQISDLALRIYDRVNWQWMMNGGATLSHGWTPEKGFLRSRWDAYCELMMLYLLAIGSRTYPIPPGSWSAWSRPILHYRGLTYISGATPLFVHQFSHAWIDFRKKRDAFADYFAISVTATRAHKLFCGSLPKFEHYTENLWGFSSSDRRRRYVEWGGPPALGPIDGTIVPSAAGGSIPFLPQDTLTVLQNIYDRFPAAWTRYAFIEAFNPLTGWYDSDVVGIAVGIVALMAENHFTQLVWNTFMKNTEIKEAMLLVGFHPDPENGA